MVSNSSPVRSQYLSFPSMYVHPNFDKSKGLQLLQWFLQVQFLFDCFSWVVIYQLKKLRGVVNCACHHKTFRLDSMFCDLVTLSSELVLKWKMNLWNALEQITTICQTNAQFILSFTSFHNILVFVPTLKRGEKTGRKKRKVKYQPSFKKNGPSIKEYPLTKNQACLLKPQGNKRIPLHEHARIKIYYLIFDGSV